MTSISYGDAVNAALERLQPTGFYLDHSFANHGPMAAEALATLGYCDQVEKWVEANLRHRDHDSLPTPATPIDGSDPADWRAALGKRERGGDWVEYFRRQLTLLDWRPVLSTWWPRLLPGMAGGLTHGLIRTAHAVRGLTELQAPTPLQRDELARGLAFWATVFSSHGRGTGSTGNDSAAGGAPAAAAGSVDAEVQAALSELTADYAGRYSRVRPGHPVPLIHTITAPAAARLVLPELPVELHRPTFETVSGVCRGLFGTFAAGGNGASTGSPQPTPELQAADAADFSALIAEAVTIGDEHAIKICEAARRENALSPDGRYFAAARTAVELIREL